MRNGSPNFLSLSLFLFYFLFLSLLCPLIKLFFISREFADIFVSSSPLLRSFILFSIIRTNFHTTSPPSFNTLSPCLFWPSLFLNVAVYRGRQDRGRSSFRSSSLGPDSADAGILGKRRNESAICSGREWIPTTRCECYGILSSGGCLGERGKNYVILICCTTV